MVLLRGPQAPEMLGTTASRAGLFSAVGTDAVLACCGVYA